MSDYQEYAAALKALQKLGVEREESDRRIVERERAASTAAHELPRRAVKETTEAKAQLQANQSAGVACLQAIGRPELLPVRVSQPKSSSHTTSQELSRLVQRHSSAIDRLSSAVGAYEAAVRLDKSHRQDEAQRAAAERSRLRAEEERRKANEEAQRVAAEAAAARRRRMVALIAAMVAVAVVVLLLALLAR